MEFGGTLYTVVLKPLAVVFIAKVITLVLEALSILAFRFASAH